VRPIPQLGGASTIRAFRRPTSGLGQTRSFRDVGSMSGLPESGHGWAIHEDTPQKRERSPSSSRWQQALSTMPTTRWPKPNRAARKTQRLHRREVDLARHTVRLYWKRSDGTPYTYLSKASRYPDYRATAS
jgi:hypothetical protein